MADIIAVLQNRFAEKDLLAGERVKDRATSFWDPSPSTVKAIVFPRSTDDVSFILAACHEAGQNIVTHGGTTGLVQGSNAGADDIVLSLERMNMIEEIDPVGGTATVQAGAILQNVQGAAADKGMLFPLDLGARGSCTIGGNVATNAGGINVIRYGMMRNLVLGLEAVLADGTVVSSMNTMLKNNAGYDLKQLFIGSEGTLGIVTRVVLRLFPAMVSSQCVMAGLESFESVVAFLKRAQRTLGGSLSAYEVMWGDYYRAVTGDKGHKPPLDRSYNYYVLCQAEGADPQADEAVFSSMLEQAFEEGEIVDAVLPKSVEENRAFWTVREDFSPLLVSAPIFLYDISVPIGDMEEYVATITAQAQDKWPGAVVHAMGHVGDSNLHITVLPGDEGASHADGDAIVYENLAPYGGSISAEHGIGTEKKAWLEISRSAAEISLMRAIKGQLDSKGILNAGVILN